MISDWYSMQEIVSFLQQLRESFIQAFEDLDGKCFSREKWDYARGKGGGEIALLRGNIFEKAAVNFSAIEGDSLPFSSSPGESFFATGVSLITHMANPHAPTAHFNLRFIQTKDRQTLGGGYDLTPMGFFYKDDALHFHSIAQTTLSPFGMYESFSQNAREYFYIPHRKKERGVGGIFFEDLPLSQVSLWEAVGNSFLEAVLPIYHKRIHQPFEENDRQIQLQWRGHYVEFNLLYDRGTRFGFLSGGNPDAILCSLPPLVCW
jgi:coproporphyrinogen III oxidase